MAHGLECLFKCSKTKVESGQERLEEPSWSLVREESLSMSSLQLRSVQA
jgi:hypothetical protein